jgi:NAD(P)H dehydrogenase (quinone)
VKHDKALIITTTLFNEHAYQAGLANAMKRVIDEFCLPGHQEVDHVYFYAGPWAAISQATCSVALE